MERTAKALLSSNIGGEYPLVTPRTNVAEDKKTVPGPVPGKDLTSKIATAYRSMPPEQRDKPPAEAADIQNPELDKAFDKMVDMYKVRRPERENAIVAFPAPATLRVPKPEPKPVGDYECPECGHQNPGSNQFCGMCGAAREDTAVAIPDSAEDEISAATSLSEGGVKHHHHHYHHHHYRNNPYLLLAVVLLLAVIAWQQWREYVQTAAKLPATPVQVKPQVPAPSQPVQTSPADKPAVQPAPSSKPTVQPPAPAPNSQAGPKKSAGQPPPTQPAATPLRQGEPPGQASAPDSPPVPTPAQIQVLTAQAVPTLPSFSAKPTMAASSQQRVTLSQGVSTGRLLRKVPPVYPLNARRLGIEGQVVLQAVIAKDGTVQDVKVVSGSPLLTDAALQAVRQWRYQPYVLNGQPVEAETQVQINFKK